ncbi:MAG: hypothetical protein ACRD4I_08290 [Candidatus Angelobacter sp.]
MAFTSGSEDIVIALLVVILDHLDLLGERIQGIAEGMGGVKSG